MSKNVHFISLGCAKNRVDTEVMLGVSGDAGWNIVEDPAEAEVIVVNTCGFIGPAKEESIDTILEMGRYKEDRCERLVELLFSLHLITSWRRRRAPPPTGIAAFPRQMGRCQRRGRGQ